MANFGGETNQNAKLAEALLKEAEKAVSVAFCNDSEP
jgi:hypothetical protein